MAQKTSKVKSKGTKNKKNNNRSKGENDALYDEIILLIVLLICILLFLSNFNLSGKFGYYVSKFVFGIIGIEAYILPFILFFGAAFYIANAGNKVAGRKTMAIIIFFMNLAAFIQLMTVEYDPTLNLFDYYINSSTLKNGGGIIGGLQVSIYLMVFDKVATYIILITIMMISFIIITGKAIFTLITKNARQKSLERRNYRMRMQEEAEKIELTVLDGNKKRRPPKIINILENDHKQPKENLDLNKEIIKSKFSNKSGNKDTNANMNKATKKSSKRTTFDMQEVLPNTELENEILKNDVIHRKIDEKGIEDTIVSNDIDFNEDDISIKNYYNDVKKQDTEKVENNNSLSEQLEQASSKNEKKYVFPPISLLAKPKVKAKGMSDSDLKDTAIKLQSTLQSFGVNVKITDISCGPSVTRYELQPEQGVKVSRITGLADDIKLNLAASDIRIEAPIPGKAAVGIEVPNSENSMVNLRDLLDSVEFKKHSSNLAFAVGKDIGGKNIVTDIGKMPHLLIAGATGSGKSVCINTLIMSLIYKSDPEDVRLIMIDPKVVELSVYNGIPHLLIPVVTEPKKASAALAWAVSEMTDRYNKFADLQVRDLKGYNDRISQPEFEGLEGYKKLPQIVIIIDELSDLMMVAPGEVEDAICRLAQMARAAGLYLIIATQRPSVNVITGLIKANVPSRIAFAVSSAIDSRTILDGSGAEKLLGKGDMLFFPSGYPKPIRVQGAFISDKEVSAVVDFLKSNSSKTEYNEEVHEQISNSTVGSSSASPSERDEYFIEAAKFIIDKDKASIGMLQRIYRIGFNRAARMMDQLYEVGIVGPDEGTKPRQVLMSIEQFEQWLEEEG